MNELQRLTYLDAIGVDSYSPRLVLPGAAESVLCEMPVYELPVNTLAADDVTSTSPSLPSSQEKQEPVVDAGKSDNGTRALGRQGVASAQALFDEEPKKKAQAPVSKLSAELTSQQSSQTATEINKPPEFSLSIIRASNVLLIDEGMTGSVNPDEYLALLNNLFIALGVGEQQLSIHAFTWPVSKKSQIDQSELAARQALEEFLSKQVDQMSRRYIVVFGETARQYIAPDHSNRGEFIKHSNLDIQLIHTHSALAMLAKPELKREVWHDLQALHQVLKNR